MINAYPQNKPVGGVGMNPIQIATATLPAVDSQFQTIDGVMWIQGEGAAKACNVLAGKTVMLLDSESDRFYIKQADQYGRPLPLQVFRYTKEETPETPVAGDFVTRKEFDELKASLDAVLQAHGATDGKGE